MFNAKKNYFKKAIFAGILIAAMVFAPIHTQKAEALWGEVMQEGLRTILDYIRNMIQDLIMGMMKQMAVKMMNQQMGGMIGGNSSQGAMFITNWSDYLVAQPMQESQVYMNDYVSNFFKGRGSSSYISNSEGFGQGAFSAGVGMQSQAMGSMMNKFQGMGASYASQMQQIAQQAISSSAPKFDFNVNPSQMFQGPNAFANMNNLFDEKKVNNGWNTQDYFRLAQAQDVANRMATQQAKAIAYQGFKGKEQGGMVLNPGSLIKENMANVQDIGNKVLANAKGIPEVITSVVQQIITQAIQQGIGNIQKSVQREVQNVQNKANQQIQNQVNQVGPGALYNQVTN